MLRVSSLFSLLEQQGSGLVAFENESSALLAEAIKKQNAVSSRDVTDTDRESFFAESRAEKTEARVSDRTDDAPSANGFSTRA